MSIDYFVIVPKGRWPSYRALNDALERRGYPVRIEKEARALSGEAVAEYPQSLGLKLLLEGQPVELEAGIDRTDANPGLIAEVNDELAAFGSPHRAQPGDVLLHVVLRSSHEEWLAACYLMAALIRECDGYAYENDEGSFGGEDFAAQLERGARCGFDYSDDQPTPAAVTQAVAPPERKVSLADWIGIARWAVALGVIGLFAAQAWFKAREAGKDPVQAVKDVFG